ncbi:prepilin-type N-terminal cleavage/methylation domain-containing protein [bacterium]|nr:prepilin-type N-terminal cleavage/methylation domain-containing protein [bacterium]
MKQHARQGFTLIEMLMVIGLIVIVVGFLGPKIAGLFGKKERAEVQFKMSALKDALNEYRMEFGTYPSSREGLRALIENPRPNDDRYRAAASKWPFVKQDAITDRSGEEFTYNCPPADDLKGKYRYFSIEYLGQTQAKDDPDYYHDGI